MAPDSVAVLGAALGKRFQLVKPLGRGGMGEVYLVKDTFRDRKVALKVARLARDLPKTGGDDVTKTERLWMNEMRLAGKLHHPYIVEIYEAGTAGDMGFLAMEYLDGGTLGTFTLPDKLLEVSKVADLIFKVTHALEYANTQGLLHRDIKPANILLAEDGTPKVTDFGSSYLLEDESTQVMDVGTLPYMPPEHFEGIEPNVQTDIYAVGVMAYVLLCGAYPHKGDDQSQVIYQKLQGTIVPLKSRRAGVPPGLEAAISKAIARDPKQRYASWHDFREDLAAAFPELGKVKHDTSESERFASYRKLTFFTGFSETELWEAVRLGKPIVCKDDEMICKEGDEDATIYIVETGELEAVRNNVRVGRIKTGEGFGEIAFVQETGHRRTVSVKAATEATLVAYPKEVLSQASGRLQAAFGRSFVRSLVSRLIDANNRYALLMKAKATGQ
jgi:serine/threonine protein kinase